MLDFVFYLFLIAFGVIPFKKIYLTGRYFPSLSATFAINLLGATAGVYISLNYVAIDNVIVHLFMSLGVGFLFLVVIGITYNTLNQISNYKIDAFFKNIADTDFKESLFSYITVISAVASAVFTAAGFYKKSEGSVVNILLDNFLTSPLEAMGHNVEVFIPESGFFRDIIFNPVNMIFISLMLYFFWVDIKSYQTKNHHDLRSPISSIGVLGTFFGVFIGLLNFDTNNIGGSIPLLLEGLKVAFFTSVVGLTLSTVLTIYQTFNPIKYRENRK